MTLFESAHESYYNTSFNGLAAFSYVRSWYKPHGKNGYPYETIFRWHQKDLVINIIHFKSQTGFTSISVLYRYFIFIHVCCLAEQNSLSNFVSRQYKERFCDFWLNFAHWLRRWCIYLFSNYSLAAIMCAGQNSISKFGW